MDDGRQGTTVLKPGMKYCNIDKKFKYSKEAEEDDKTRKLAGETVNQRMARICQIAMNSINKNLQFTVESEDDYEDKKLPTLDFKIWQEKDGKINHTYYQKEMKSPYLIMARSAAPQTQKIQILSNELTRRLLNINRQEIGQEEYNKVVDQFTQEAFNSEYGHTTTRTIVISGIRAWKARQERRVLQGQEIYRPASSTLKTRTRKKLLARENWYKENEESKNQNPDKKYDAPGLPGGPRALGTKNKVDKNIGQDKNVIKAVMFVPYTTNGTLAKMLRQNEEKLVEMTGTRLKIIERTGTKIQDILTKSNPWQGQDCHRKNCLLCITKTRTGKLTSQDCSKRNIVYETSCATCEETQLEELENSELEEQEKSDKKKCLKLFKYVGESSRSAYERGWEHLNDMAKLDPKSHMLKHVLTHHPGQDIMTIKFNMKIRKFCRTSFERQILESVTIQHERNEHSLMNSKSEYNRCSLPRLSTMMGENEYKEYNDSKEQEKIENEALDKKIRELRKEMNKARLHPTKESGPKPKRRKIGTGTNDYIDIQEIWGKPTTTRQEKSKKTSDQNPKQAKLANTEQKTPEKFRIPTFPPPPPPKPEISQLLSKQEQFRQERLQIKQEKEQAYELRRLCRKFLEENDKGWEKRRKERIEEQERLLRQEKTKILSKQAKIKHIEKSIEIGMEKIPKLEKERLELEEKKKRKLELQQTKQDLWKLRKQEKKQVQNAETTKIKEMSKKLEVLKEILEQEKEKAKEQVKEQARKAKKKENDLKVAAEKSKKWAMIRWVNDYIEENQEKWDNDDLIRTLDKYEHEKETRLEIIRNKKRKLEDPFDKQDALENKQQKQQETQITNIQQQPEKTKWRDWRQQTNNNPEKTTNNKQVNEPVEQETNNTKLEINVKLKQPTLVEIMKGENKKQEKCKINNTNKQQRDENLEKNNKTKTTKTQITSKTETNKTRANMKQQTTRKNTKAPEQTTSSPIIRKPTLQHKPAETTTPNKQQNIQQMFNNLNKQQETNQKTTTTPVTKPNKIETSSQKTKKVSKTAEKKTKKQTEKKGIKQLQGFWVKFAEEQKQRRLNQNKPPELAALDQSYCKVKSKPSTPVQGSGDVLESSNSISNPVRVLKSENTSTIKGKSTSRTQLGQGQSVYKES